MDDLSRDELRRLVYTRAKGCCEYCQTCEVNTGQTMQIDHINPNGSDDLSNLALSCWNCNNHKRRATHAYDPQTKTEVPLFHPRQQLWSDHFQWIDGYIRVNGLTSSGRATVDRLKMNRDMLVFARKRWVEAGYHPPKLVNDTSSD